jgi:hypothetical protein
MAGKRNERKWQARGGMSKETVKCLVRERDNERCTQCGMTDDEHFAKHGRRNDVHRKTPGGLYTLEGCVLLCYKCHGPQPRRKRGTKDQEYAPPRPIQVSLGKSPFVILRGDWAEAVRGLAERTGQTVQDVVLASLERHFVDEGLIESPPKA